MAILDVLQYFDESGQTMAARIGPSQVNMGSQLIVQESQSAVFYRDGKALDTFGPGRYTLSTQNIPILAKLVNLPFGGNTPFPVQVVFLNMRDFLDLKWGTPEPVLFRDSEFDMVELRAFGKFSMRLKDPRLFIGKVVAQKTNYRVSEMEEWLRTIIVQHLNDTLGENLKTLLDLAKHYNEIAAGMKTKVSAEFERYGVEMTAFYLGAITAPEEVQKALKQRSALGVLGPKMSAYQQKAMADALGDAAKNPSGGAGQGMGFGVGMMMPQMMAQQQAAASAQQAQASAAAATESCPKCRAAVTAGSKFCPACGAPMGILCVGCQAPLPASAKFCPACGKPQSASCPKCNAVLSAGAKFCPGCGSPA
ncbi:MAG: SPFH domain-containing protein [Candidatus Brocadiae bacterium]|nr:SPFH domain-containing protein [Candidatus Brocadiia bacterium]